MAEFELHTELLTNMEVEQLISKRGSTAVYLVRSTKTQQAYVLKHISVRLHCLALLTQLLLIRTITKLLKI